MVISEVATLRGVEPFASWNTPICWTGFLLFADGCVYRARGDSWMRSAPREFAALAIVSIPLWLVFEWFNRYLQNWHYVGLPQNPALRDFGYAWAFATIWPAIFEAAELVAVLRGTRRAAPYISPAPAASPARPALAVLSIAVGALMLASPFLLRRYATYMAAPVWLGFILVLDPINARLGGESLTTDLRAGNRDRLTNLVLSGFLCGGLWEFWNYWSRAKWIYTVPILGDVKIFEMPVLGYFGFPAFALECFTMYVFVRLVFTRGGRPIAM
jgi:hypothetical protein